MGRTESLDKRISGPHSRLGQDSGPTESLDKRIIGPHSRFGQETRWTPQSVSLLWKTQQSAPLRGSNHIIQPHANHYPVLVTAWWSQVVTNTSINHAQCCSTGAWYDHETTRGGKKCTVVLYACWLFHSFTCSNISDRVRRTWVSSMLTRQSLAIRELHVPAVTHMYSVWPTAICGSVDARCLICLRTEEKAEGRTMTSTQPLSIRQLHSQ